MAGEARGSRWADARTTRERQRLMLEALEACAWNQGDAAWRLGTRRETVNRKLREWGGRQGLERLVSGTASTAAHVTPVTAGYRGLGASQGTTNSGNAGGLVQASYSPVLTSRNEAPNLSAVQHMPAAAPEPTRRVPPIQFTPDAEEDWFISQEIAVGRLTGGPRTRLAVIKCALRAYMESRRPTAAGSSQEPPSVPAKLARKREPRSRR